MHRTAALLLLTLVAQPATGQRVPDAPRVDSSGTYFGTVVADPYRWLERYTEPTVRAWYEAEDAAARAFLGARPAQAHVLRRLAEARQSRPYVVYGYTERGGRLFYLKRLPDETGPSLYVRDDGGTERRLLAPTEIDAASPVIAGYAPSPTGAHVAVFYALGGSEHPHVRLLETATRRALDELPEHVLGIEWMPDGRAFLYRRYRDLPNDATFGERYGGLPVLVHRLGTDGRAGGDAVVADPAALGGDGASLLFVGPVDPASGVVVAAWRRETENRWQVVSVADAGAVARGGPVVWHPLTVPTDSVTSVFARGPWLYGVRFTGARMGALVRVPWAAPPRAAVTSGAPAAAERPDWAAAEVVIPAGPFDFWQDGGLVSYASDAMYTIETAAGQSGLFRTTYSGVREEIAAPFDGSFADPVWEFGRPGVDVVFGGWTVGDRRFRYDPASRRMEERPAFYNPPDPYDHLDGLTAETVLVPSHDGVEVPLTLLRVAAAGDEPRPTILHGYGAYGATDDAFFRADNRPWLDAGGQVAFCHVRGGGYFGPAWHEAGMREAKPNTWLDAVACAEHLVRAGRARPDQIGIDGVSAGGVFVGRAIETRPDLFGAAVAEVALADLIRFETGSVGPVNAHEFGSTATEAGFRSLLAMSPLHHVEPGTRYPATMFYAAYNDRRVAPWHPAKLAAALRHAGGPATLPDGDRPVLLYVDFEAGHGASDTVAAREARTAAVLAFFADRLGLAMP